MTNDGDWRPKRKSWAGKRWSKWPPIAAPETLLTWHRNLIGRKHAGSTRQPRGRTPTRPEIAALAVRMAEENRSWGYRRRQGVWLGSLFFRTFDEQRFIGLVVSWRVPPSLCHRAWLESENATIRASRRTASAASPLTFGLATWWAYRT